MSINPGLRALRDCGVVRARTDDDRYRSLVDRALAHAAVPINAPNKRDFRLTTKGRACAASLHARNLL